MPRHHMQHVRNVGPNLFERNENSAYVMQRGTAHVVMSCTHRAGHAHRQAGYPMYTWHARNYLWMCCSCKPNDIYQK